MTDEQLQRKIEMRKSKRGGARKGAGRPKRMDEQAIIEKLTPMSTTAFAKLNEKILEGDMNAIKLFMQYFIGLPTQKIESKIEGQLNQVSVEVLKPEVKLEKVA